MKHLLIAALAFTTCAAGASPAGAADTARDVYARALARERAARDESNHATLVEMHRIVAMYEEIARRYRASGYADNALWQAANLSKLAYDRFGQEPDRDAARAFFARLARDYPASSLAAGVRPALEALDGGAEAAPAAAGPVKPAPKADSAAAKEQSAAQADAANAPVIPPPPVDNTPGHAPSGVVMLKDIHRESMPDGVRVTIDLDKEVAFHQEEIEHPRRIFFDLKGVRAAPPLQDTTLKFDSDVVREIRLGRHPQNVTRLVLDIEGVAGYTVYPLYGPYRLVIDFKRSAGAAAASAPPPAIVPPLPSRQPAVEPAAGPTLSPGAPDTRAASNRPGPAASAPPKGDPNPPPAPDEATASSRSPGAPAANSDGKFSLSRQLGLSVSRIVIDAGHGGHDPGAQGSGVNESELTLDVALRLRKLLEKQPGMEVVMTRDTDVFIPLQERTAIANHEEADLFLSIHANASRNAQARGIETYFLNFALNPEAEAVAARENAGSSQGMHTLPDIVKAIALNNKINESRDFATTVQRAMIKRLRPKNRELKDLGVKQAPFVVLIGASMPSVLAEISFVTNKREGTLLKSGAYRQAIAQALFDAVVSYQNGLKKMNIVAGKKATY
jgi:N-acetylmuramoyl-L-alanine amidase